jgi:uncharacterized protein (TIGR04255 family)
MARYRHLSKAPIGEALLDIRTQPSDEVSIEALQKIDLLLDGYGNRQETKRGHLHLDFDDATKANAQVVSTTMGYAFQNQQKTRLIQISRDGFTQHFLPPYPNGDLLLEEAKKNWAHYVAIAAPLATTRLAMRYINRFRLPRQIIDFNDYLVASPQIPSGLPQGIANFFSKVVLVNPVIGAHAGVSQIFTGEIDESGVEVILDIDVFFEGVDVPTDSAIWKKFDELRGFKNDIFFGFVTDKLLEAYE